MYDYAIAFISILCYTISLTKEKYMKILLTVLTLTACVTVLATESETVYTPEKTYTCWVYDDSTRICY